MKTTYDFTRTKNLPPPDTDKSSALLSAELKKSAAKIVVLDDDPTGVQTVHGICVYTDWNKESLLDGLLSPDKMFFVLTNSRSFTAEQTARVHREIAENLAWAAKESGKDFILISRGDSTLRGHYPLETQVLKDTLTACGYVFDGEIICPFFKEGGRLTAGNTHYVLEKGIPTPAGETEFAKDKTFGFTSSDLCEWIEEKTAGKTKSADVTAVSLEELRDFNVPAIEQKLRAVKAFGKVVVNALDEADLQVFCTALYCVLGEKRFLFRTAASFVKILGGISSKPLLKAADLIAGTAASGGLIIAGSHTKKTTAQLAQLSECENVATVEFNQHLVVESDTVFEAEIHRALRLCEEYLQTNKTVCLCTRRERFDLNTGNKEDELKAAVKISDALTSIVARLSVRPRFVLAKGGITSSDTGTKGLSVKRAAVAGQIQPGIPVWICGEESKFPNLPYIIFPGNVGEDGTLRAIVEELS